MKTKYVIGNWKCNKGIDEARTWFAEFARQYRPVKGLMIVVAPSFICLLCLNMCRSWAMKVRAKARGVSLVVARPLIRVTFNTALLQIWNVQYTEG